MTRDANSPFFYISRVFEKFKEKYVYNLFVPSLSTSIHEINFQRYDFDTAYELQSEKYSNFKARFAYFLSRVYFINLSTYLFFEFFPQEF